MKKFLAVVAFTFLFTATVVPATFPNQNGQALIVTNGAEIDW
jgi:hypothetical protein